MLSYWEILCQFSLVTHDFLPDHVESLKNQFLVTKKNFKKKIFIHVLCVGSFIDNKLFSNLKKYNSKSILALIGLRGHIGLEFLKIRFLYFLIF